MRPFYASVLLNAGESVKALSDYLGHADPGFTLRTCTHLMPSSEDRTRRAIDHAFRQRTSQKCYQSRHAVWAAVKASWRWRAGLCQAQGGGEQADV
ncbi:hypothetical protein GCM10027259_07510 [Micromonospora palomenae]